MDEIEEWRPVGEAVGIYEISSLGRLRKIPSTRRTPANYIVPLQTHPQGRLEVSLQFNGQILRRKVHRLVAFAFLGRPAHDRLEVCHNDGNPKNNVPSNLRWDTHKSNMQDMILHGTHSAHNKTQCKYGHEFSGKNLRVSASGERVCRTCDLARTHKHRAKKRAQRLEPAND